MTWATSTRRRRLPPNWAALRVAVLHRDGHRCTARMRGGGRCPQRATDVDHIVAGDNHALDNLQALCRWHHKRKTAAESAAARRTRRHPTRRRPAEDHPGLC